MVIPCLEVKLREDDRGAAGDQRAAGERENIDLKREDWSSFTRATGQMVIGKQELQDAVGGITWPLEEGEQI